MTPTGELYSAIELMYDHFNCTLFNNELPSVVLTMQKQKRVMGYFSPSSWASKERPNSHEIAINPDYIASFPLIEICQTLAHEQCHCWQYVCGTPSRNGYHNREWADKMVSIGLMPSSTGKPGGKELGQKMSDYPAPNGLFLSACFELVNLKHFTLPWVAVKGYVSSDGVKDFEGIEDSILTMPIAQALGVKIEDKQNAPNLRKQKQKYSCVKCLTNVWGKPNLNIFCDDCKLPFMPQEQ